MLADVEDGSCLLGQPGAVAPDVEATFVGLDDLVRMKKAAGRPQDLSDIEQLEIPSGERDDD